MIFEQAFHYLPEILSGKSYPRQDHEGGIVAAFTMAVLQELNARNAANPLSLIQCEKLYRPKAASWPSLNKNSGPRYLRADMRVSLHEMKQGNSSLSAYGWRHANWLEAKFFRAFHAQTGMPKANGNQSLHTGSLLADLYRILALCPRGVPRKLDRAADQINRSNVGRYLLHVYSGRVDQHLSLNMRGHGERQWIRAITKPGQQSLENFLLQSEPSAVRQHVGTGLTDLRLDFNCTNFVISPVETQPKSVTYTSILTRIDAFKLTRDGVFWGVGDDRAVTCSAEDDASAYKAISEFVAARIEIKPEIETQKPVPSDIEAPEDHDSDADD